MDTMKQQKNKKKWQQKQMYETECVLDHHSYININIQDVIKCKN